MQRQEQLVLRPEAPRVLLVQHRDHPPAEVEDVHLGQGRAEEGVFGVRLVALRQAAEVQPDALDVSILQEDLDELALLRRLRIRVVLLLPAMADAAVLIQRPVHDLLIGGIHSYQVAAAQP